MIEVKAHSDYDGPELPVKSRPASWKLAIFAVFIIGGLTLLALAGIFINEEKARVALYKQCNQINNKMLDEFGIDGKLVNVQNFCDGWKAYKDLNCPVEVSSAIFTVNQFCG